MKTPRVKRPDSAWRPTELFAMAERTAKAVRRQIESFRRGKAKRSGSTDDALAIALLIEQLSRKGRLVKAAESIEIAADVEQLLELLRSEIDVILAF